MEGGGGNGVGKWKNEEGTKVGEVLTTERETKTRKGRVGREKLQGVSVTSNISGSFTTNREKVP